MANFALIEHDDRYSKRIALLPVGFRIDIADLQLELPPDKRQQLFDQDFTHMAAGAAVYLYFRQSQRPGLHGARIAILGVKRCRQRLRLIR